jgi:hypothetical protein
MALVNRDKDVSEQKVSIHTTLNVVNTGLSIPLFAAPYPLTVMGVKVSALGVSGTPTGVLQVVRNSAAGSTAIAGGWTTLTLQAAGTSGPQTMVQAAAGSSFLSLGQGDVLQYVSAGSASAAFVAVDVVVQCLQDIKSDFGF